MTDFQNNEQNDNIEIKNEPLKEEVLSEEEELSTVFGNPIAHEDVKKTVSPKKRLYTVIASVLAVAILIGSTVAVIKLIPEKDSDNESSIQTSEITVLDLDVEKIKEVTVKNGNGTFKFIPTRIENTSDDEGAEPTVTTVWNVNGMDSKYTNSSHLASIASAAASISAISEIDGKSVTECGLDKPLYTVTMTMEDDSVCVVDFGAASPDGIGNYMKVSNQDKIYLVEASVPSGFEFELIDLADTTAISGLPVTKLESKYVSDEKVSGFDTITFTGKNFQTPLVIEMSKDTAFSDYFAYVIVSPETRVADKVDEPFNMFINGLTVDGAYSYDVGADSLKKFGLDNPYLSVTIKIGNYTDTFKFSKIDEEYCAVINKNSYMIRKVPISSISFIDYNAENFYATMAYLKSISDVDEFGIEIGDISHNFKIVYDEEAEENQYTITCDGKGITAEFFQGFYQDFAGTIYTDYKTDVKISSPDMKFTLKLKDGKTDILTYHKDTATRYAFAINGKVMGRISSTDYNRLVKDLENVVQNKDIP